MGNRASWNSVLGSVISGSFFSLPILKSSILCFDFQQKVVIKLSLHDDKTRSKAMKTAVGVDGKLPNSHSVLVMFCLKLILVVFNHPHNFSDIFLEIN